MTDDSFKGNPFKPVWFTASQASTLPVAPLSPQSKQDVLRARAKKLSEESHISVVDDTIEVAEFLLGNESYAFELDYLREVCPLSDVTHIPCSPPFVVGVINLRGQIIPIIDILKFLNISSSQVHVFNKSVILQKDKLVVGILADEVVGATNIQAQGLQNSLSLSGEDSAGYLRGVTRDRMVVLNARNILDDARLCPKREEA